MFSPFDLLIVGCLVFFSYTAQAMTGFGSIVIALTIGSLLFPIRALIPVLVALNMPLCIWILYKQYKEIDQKFLWLSILPLMTVGLIIGVIVDQQLEGPTLRRIFGSIILFFAIRELYLLLFNRKSPKQEQERLSFFSRAINWFWILVAGLVHGIYASGGPPLVYALSRSQLSRSGFRATLTAVWLILNGALLVLYLYDGRFGGEETKQFFALLIAIPLALKAGEWLHTRVSERSFRLTLQGLLALSAAALLV